MDFTRSMAHGDVYAMTDLPVPANAAYHNRGAAVRLVDRILEEAGYRDYPPQRLAARALPEAASEARLLAHRTAAQRRAAVEDTYMEYLP